MIEQNPVPAGSSLSADLCIVGAGATGIALAVTMAERGRKVLILESGGEAITRERSRLNRADWVSPLPDPPLQWARERALGGTTTVWSGRIAQLRSIDFEARPWIAHSGWPFGGETLAPYYERARSILGFEPASRARLEPLDGLTEIERIDRRVGADMAEQHRQTLEHNPGIRVLLGADVVGLTVRAGRVTEVRAASQPGRPFEVRARQVVLAAGGIENPRLLLESNVGNGEDLVGRFFADRPFMNVGTVDADPGLEPFVGGDDPAGPHYVMVPSERFLREEELSSCSLYLKPDPAVHSLQASYGSAGAQALRQLSQGAQRREFPDRMLGKLGSMLRQPGRVGRAYRPGAKAAPPGVLGVRMAAEPTPNRDSRVTLSNRRDKYGRRLPRVDWRLNELERRSLNRFGELIVRSFERGGLPTPRLTMEDGPHGWPASMRGGYHHMGATRMHASPRQGVVDPRGRVHGVANLWVVGTSVFPSFGHAHPTLTAVALTVRTADALSSAGA